MSDSRYGIILTIFTPTYNRTYSLPRLYSSLLDQTDKRFEWLVVDDGSEDGTEGLISKWARGASFPIRYIRQENSGKHVAHNLGAREAAGALFMCVDSDDWLESFAVETILADSAALDTEESLLYPKLFTTQAALDTWFPDGVGKIELADMRMKYGLDVETAIVFNVDVLLRHPFPVIEGERYVPEESAYYDFHDPELFLVRNATFYRCEYLGDGLTKNIWRNWFNNPVGTRMALLKRYGAAGRYSNVRALRQKVSAIAGIESLNMAYKTGLRTGIKGAFLLSALCFPIAAHLCKKRFGRIP